MSKSKIVPPPFTEDDDVQVIPRKTMGPVIKDPARSAANRSNKEQPKEDPKRRGPDLGKERTDPKRPRLDTSLPPPPPSSHVPATQFAALGHKYVSESDLNQWASSSLEENNSAMTRLAAELFHRQASRHKELRGLFLTNSELKKDILNLKSQVDQLEEDKKSLVASHKKQLHDETSQLKKDLTDARNKVNDLEKDKAKEQKDFEEKLKELNTQISNLQVTTTGFAADKEEAVSEALALGQVKFMKGFMRKLPEFDWGQLGEATRVYAEQLRTEMEAEEKQRAEEEAESSRQGDGAA